MAEIFEKLTGLGPEDTVTEEYAAKTVMTEIPRYIGTEDPIVNDELKEEDIIEKSRLCILINQADTEEDMITARRLAAGLDGIVCYAGSMINGDLELLSVE